MIWTDEQINDLVASIPVDPAQKYRIIEELIEVRARYEARIAELEDPIVIYPRRDSLG